MKRKSLFFRYFYSYIGIVVFSVAIFGMLFYYSSATILNAEVKSNQFSSVSQSLGKVDYMLESMSNIAYHFSSREVDSGYYEYRDQKESEAFAGLMAQRLGSYTQNMTEDAELLLYFRGGVEVYLEDGMRPYAAFEEHVGRNTNLTMSSFFSTLNSTLNPKALRLLKEDNSSQDGPLAAFVYPVPYMSLIPEASLAFLITEREFTAVFDNYSGEGKRNTYLLDDHLNMIYSSEAAPLDERERAALVSVKGTGAFDQPVQGRPSVVMRALSENTGYSLIVVMEEREFYSRVDLMQRVIIACALLFVAVSVLWALIMAVRNYRPIRDLARSSADEGEDAETDSGGNELEIIRRRIRSAHLKNRELGRLIDSQRPYVVFTCLGNLLRGKLDDWPELRFQLHQAGVEFPEPVFLVLLTSPAGRDGISEKIQCILAACEEISLANCYLYSVEIVLDRQVAIIANCREETVGGQPAGVAIARLLQELLRESGVEISVGIGSARARLEDVHTSFVEAAVVAGEYLASYGGNIMRFEEIPAKQNLDYSFSLVDQSVMVQSLRQGDAIAALAALDRLLGEVRAAGGSFLITQYLCFDIANTLFKTIGQAGGEVRHSDLHSLGGFQDVDEFQAKARELVESICEQFDSAKARKDSQLGASVIEYVSGSYRDNSLSLEGAASVFELSASHLSRFFKQATGQTFSQYVTGLRMNYIKAQLSGTDRQIKDIVTDAGYIDVASFVRKFKSAEGLTPGQYRQATRKGGSIFG